MSRYDNSPIYDNKAELYDGFFQERSVNFIRQYKSGTMSHPTVEQRASLQKARHVWRLGDRLYKLAHKHYGDSRLWWVIAWYNMKPTDSHFRIGDTVFVPMPLEKVLSMLQRT